MNRQTGACPSTIRPISISASARIGRNPNGSASSGKAPITAIRAWSRAAAACCQIRNRSPRARAGSRSVQTQPTTARTTKAARRTCGCSVPPIWANRPIRVGSRNDG
ncbi:hypothetical protein ACFV0H_13210 [Streptomyces erythrochromogenes]|uniref:hypothetical protein n=1 Tax=Streptomyces erythrochromogenes TaxID=285574 RepID=UPI00367A4FD9